MRRKGTFSLTELDDHVVHTISSVSHGWEEKRRDFAAHSNEQVAKALRKKALEGEEDDPRTMDIMMLLDIDKVPSIRNEFETNEEGLTQTEFVSVMMKYLKRASLEETQLVSDLCELFAQIDVNGDGTMEWDEFTSFIVDTGNNGRENEPNSIQQYHQSDWYDESKHAGHITHSYYFGGLNRIATCEDGSNILNLYHPQSLTPDRVLHHKSGNVLCAAHLDGQGLLALAGSNLSICLYDDQSHRLLHEFPTETSQTCLEWAKNSSTLFSAGVNGVIQAWDVENGCGSYSMGGVIFDGNYYLMSESHTDMVLDLLQITPLESLASASMDRTIKLWDIHTGKLKKTLEGHAKGVRSLSYSADYRFMVSAGFDFDAYVWNPYVEHLILRLHGHNAPLCKVDMVPGTPQILTADTAGVFKVWDIRNFGCVQTFSVETADLRDFAYATPYKSLVAVGRRMQKFDYEKLQNPELTDDLPVFQAIFNATTMTFLTATGRDIKLWDARKGTTMNRFRGLSDTGELSAVCLDDRERKFLTGDHDGVIRVFDYMNGSLMKEFAYPDRAHDSEVSGLLYCNEHKVVISSGWDDTIIIHDEMDAERGVLLRKLEGGHLGSDITALAYSHKLELIASGSPNPNAPIVLWGFEFGRVEAVLSPDIESLSSNGTDSGSQNRNRFRSPQKVGQMVKSVTALVFVDQHFPGLISSDDGGGIVFWAVRPAKEWRNRALVRFVNRSDQQNSSISSLCVDQANARLYASDEKGFIKVWDYSQLLEKVVETIGGEKYKPVVCENARRKIHTDNRTVRQETKEKDSLSSLGGTASPTTNMHTHSVFRSAQVISEVSAWRAHADAIQSMQLVLDGARSCLITAAHDCLVKIFDLNGTVLGTLRQGEDLGGINWKFEIDVEARRAQQLGKASEILLEISNPEAGLLHIIDEDDSSSVENELEDLSLANDAGTGTLALPNHRPTERFDRSAIRLSGTLSSTNPYQRRTPRLAPIDAKNAGRGLSISLKGKTFRSRQYNSSKK